MVMKFLWSNINLYYWEPEKSAVEHYAKAVGNYDLALERIVADLKKIAPLDNLVPLVNLYKKPIDEKVLKYYNHIKRKHKGEKSN